MIDLIKNLPLFIKLFFAMKKFLDDAIEEEHRQKKIQQLTDSFKFATTTGETSEIEKALRNIAAP